MPKGGMRLALNGRGLPEGEGRSRPFDRNAVKATFHSGASVPISFCPY